MYMYSVHPKVEQLCTTLGLSKYATYSEIKSAYRSTMRVLHPDALPTDMPADDKSRAISRFQLLRLRMEEAQDHIFED
mgnify:CR=1 FL=1